RHQISKHPILKNRLETEVEMFQSRFLRKDKRKPQIPPASGFFRKLVNFDSADTRTSARRVDLEAHSTVPNFVPTIVKSCSQKVAIDHKAGIESAALKLNPVVLCSNCSSCL